VWLADIICATLVNPQTTGIARGCSGCTCTPRAEKKHFRRSLQGKFVSALHPNTPSAPPGRARVNFGHYLLGGGDLEVGVVHIVVLDRRLRATTKKTFLKKKCTLR